MPKVSPELRREGIRAWNRKMDGNRTTKYRRSFVARMERSGIRDAIRDWSTCRRARAALASSSFPRKRGCGDRMPERTFAMRLSTAELVMARRGTPQERRVIQRLRCCWRCCAWLSSPDSAALHPGYPASCVGWALAHRSSFGTREKRWAKAHRTRAYSTTQSLRGSAAERKRDERKRDGGLIRLGGIAVRVQKRHSGPVFLG